MMDTNKSMNIFFCVNNDYIKQLLVAMVSVLENNSDSELTFYVFTNDMTQKNMDCLYKLKNTYNNIDIKFIEPDRKIFEPLKLSIDYITIETYFRYIIADSLPDIDKGLYLDADLVVNGNLTELYNINLKNNYCAGAIDTYIERIGYKNEIGISESEVYVNAGVLLLNLKIIRENNIAKELFKNTTNKIDTIKFQDQDIINLTFKERIIVFPSIFNFTSECVRKEKHNIKKAKIVHYTGKNKPWMRDCKHKMKFIWKIYEEICALRIENKQNYFGLKVFVYRMLHNIRIGF